MTGNGLTVKPAGGRGGANGQDGKKIQRKWEMGPETINGVYIQVKLRATGYGGAGMGLWYFRTTPATGQRPREDDVPYHTSDHRTGENSVSRRRSLPMSRISKFLAVIFGSEAGGREEMRKQELRNGREGR